MTERADGETKRGRVRRLLIEPLERGGMRMRKGADAAAHRAFLDRLCDDLAYLGDDGLAAVRRWAEVNGDGKGRCFWPPFVAFAWAAQAWQPRPVEELPEMRRWFASMAGIEARAVPGRLVAELRFIERHRRPPVHAAERQRVASDAAALAAEAARACEMRDRGRMHDAALLEAFERDQARAAGLVAAGEMRRAG